MDETIDFWSYSLDAYSRPGVATACLALQEDLGLDVNVLLYCCWHGTTRGLLNDRDFTTLLEFTNRWSSALVKPLRSARSWLKDDGCDIDRIPREDCEALRQRIKEAELASERLQQLAMESLSVAPNEDLQPDSAQGALQNIATYLRTLDASVSDESCKNLAAILSVVFPEIDRASIAETLSIGDD
ncbi:MAG: TIGR02444 family protein [Gammaproteobacteria bacterium]